tara:strand:- start:44 stop:226 length:183 start_codon:yes stop_codon:yes gene_type:complete
LINAEDMTSSARARTHLTPATSRSVKSPDVTSGNPRIDPPDATGSIAVNLKDALTTGTFL